MHICLINPPMDGAQIPENELYKYDESIFSMQHLGLGYVASSLIKDGYDVDIVECPLQNLKVKDLLKLIALKSYDAIGISAYYYNIKNVARIVSKIKNINEKPFVFCGGYFPTLQTETIFDILPQLDCVVLGEGELTSVALLNALKNNLPLKDVPGIAYIDNGKVIINKPLHIIENLDTLPFPVRVINDNIKFFSVITTRGCYNSCSFCSIKNFYSFCTDRIRSRSLANVIVEINEIIKFNPYMIKFPDEVFITHSQKRRQWIKEFCEYILTNKIQIKFNIQIKATDIKGNEDLLLLLKKAGLTYVFVGIESFSKRQLNYYNKRTSVQQNISALQVLKALDISYLFGFMLLDPYSTKNDLVENLHNLKYHDIISGVNIRQNLISSNILEAIPGTLIYDNLLKKGMLQQEAPGYQFNDPQISVFDNYRKKWIEKIKPLDHYLFYNGLKNEFDRNEENAKQFSRVRRKLLQLDLDYLIDLLIIGQFDDVKMSDTLKKYYSNYLKLSEIAGLH